MPDHPLGGRFVLDTSTFLTEEIRRGNEDLEAAVTRLLDLVAEARLELDLTCYVPPSVSDELVGILDDRDVADEVISELDTWVVEKDPARYEVSVPAELLYGYVGEMADRVDRGLGVSEAAVRRVETASDADGPDHMSAADRAISDLRDEYRSTLRRGVPDSRADVDLVILARELDAGVVTEDTGIRSWAGDLGLRYLRGREFPALLEGYLRAADGESPVEGTAGR